MSVYCIFNVTCSILQLYIIIYIYSTHIYPQYVELYCYIPPFEKAISATTKKPTHERRLKIKKLFKI